jgi:hypothetical protein
MAENDNGLIPAWQVFCNCYFADKDSHAAQALLAPGR